MTLKELRINANMTQKKAAKLIGISERTLRYWETGTITLNIAYRERIAKVYRTPVKEIDF